jgi:hypothetical protein
MLKAIMTIPSTLVNLRRDARMTLFVPGVRLFLLHKCLKQNQKEKNILQVVFNF